MNGAAGSDFGRNRARRHPGDKIDLSCVQGNDSICGHLPHRRHSRSCGLMYRRHLGANPPLLTNPCDREDLSPPIASHSENPHDPEDSLPNTRTRLGILTIARIVHEHAHAVRATTCPVQRRISASTKPIMASPSRCATCARNAPATSGSYRSMRKQMSSRIVRSSCGLTASSAARRSQCLPIIQPGRFSPPILKAKRLLRCL